MTLLERERQLRALNTMLAEAAAGGRAALIGGEAGIGKTALVEGFAEEQRGKVRVLWGACDDLFSPRPLGPLYEIARSSRNDLIRLIESAASRLSIFSAFLDDLQRGTAPTLVVFEDIHWADEATLDLIKFLGRRIQRAPVLMILTYRDDELGPDHPLRRVLGDLPPRSVRHVRLDPLSESAVADLADRRGRPARDLHAVTGGNPFFVTEVLAGDGQDIPPTVRDAVLARAARLSLSGRAVLDAAATLGPRIEPWLLAEVVRAEAQAADECMAIGMLVAQGDLLSFRHELARQTILQSISPPRRMMLHRLALDALKMSPATRDDFARLAHHAEAAGDPESVLAYAPEAARRAAAAGAHREAAALYALALRYADDQPTADRAELFETYARECGHLDQPAEAIEARRKALDLWRETGNRLKEGELLALTAHSLVGMGRNAEAEQVSRAAIAVLEPLAATPELALAYRMQAHLRMLNRDFAEAIRWGEQAINLAERFGDRNVLTMAYNSVGSALMFSDFERGCAYLERSLALARDLSLDFYVANAFLNLGSGSGELHRFQKADRYLAEGIAYCAERDLDVLRLYMLAWQSLTQVYLGRWREAEEAAGEVLQQPGAMTISRIVALVALGRLRARRGDGDATTVLDEALTLAEGTQTLQRLAPVRAARAEAAWLNGERARALEEARAAYDLATNKQHAWFTGELAFWRWRAGDAISIPPWTATPFALHIAGDWRGAAAEWERLDCPYEQAQALADGDEAAQLAALALFEQVGANPAANALRYLLRARRVRGVPRGPRPATRRNAFGLTAREMDVLTLLADNLANADIAARLSISPRTVEHHVSAVLAKLRAGSRGEAIALAQQRGLVETKPYRPPK
jgi:DNA-binding CsgD family transcriptional regulator